MTKQTSEANRRVAPRRRAKQASKVSCITGKFGLGANVAVALLDISETGVRLIVQSAVASGQEVQISLEPIGARRPTSMAATVAWCIALADGTHCIGARFDKPLNWTLLQGLSAF
jgi:hypothetical protein